MLAAIRDRSDLNGKEKLKTIFKESIMRPVQNDIFTAAPDFHNIITVPEFQRNSSSLIFDFFLIRIRQSLHSQITYRTCALIDIGFPFVCICKELLNGINITTKTGGRFDVPCGIESV